MRSLRLGVLFLAFSFASVLALFAANVDWSNGAGSGDWNNGANWTGGLLPTSADTARINLAGASRTIFSSSTNIGALNIGNSANGELLITNGTLNTVSVGTRSTVGSFNGSTGTLTITNGTFISGGYVEVGFNAGANGVMNVAGGLFDVSRNSTISGISAVSLALGDGNGAVGKCILSGGELRTRTGILLGANGGTGRFEVRGAGVANIGSDNSADDGFWVQSSGSTLAAYVTNGNLGSILVDNLSGAAGTYSDGNVIFMPGSKLELGFLGAPTPGAWDLMTFEGALLTNGLALASGTDTNWSFAFVTNGAITTLRITYISANLNPPTGLVAVPGNAQATLRWSAASGATNYFVKRATTPGGPYTVTNTTTGLSFTDTGLTNGVTYFYVVSAAMTNGLTGNSSEVRATPMNGKFVHPGVMHTAADLDRMRTKVVAGQQPWADGYAAFIADSHSSAASAMQGPLPVITRGPGLPSQWENDCSTAYQNALMWYLNGDPDNAAKAIQILDAWAGTCTNMNGSDARLTAGLQGYKYITAAEIIRHTGAAWSQAQINTCSNFIRTVLLPQNKMYGGGNWGICGAVSEMAAGVFMEDEGEFNDAVNALKFGAPIECDMGIVNYINPGGWTTEADRDIGHWALGLENHGAGAQIAWCQGVDLWTYLNNRLLAGHEYLAKYNLSNSVSYTAGQQCDGFNNNSLTQDGWGRWDLSFYEQAYHPYQNLLGVPAPFTEIAVSNTRAFFAGGSYTDYVGNVYSGYNDGIHAERYDRDHVSFGTLVAALPPRAAGLPRVPPGLTSTWSNGIVSLVWNSVTNVIGYNVKRAVSRGGPYTNLASAITATNYTDNTAANNTLYFYKVSATNAVGETADSGLASAYPSATAPAAPTGVSARTTSHQRIDLAWSASAGATSYTVKRGLAPGGPFTNIASGVGTTFLIYASTGLQPNTTYYYVVAATNSIGLGADSAAVSATTLPSLPSPWNFSDAGYLTTPGNMTYTNGAFTVRGAGLDYGGLYNNDAFGFAYVNLTGDGTIIARYASRQVYSQIGKNGLAMRESLAFDSKHAFVYIGNDDTANFVYRSTTGSGGTGTGSTNVPGSALPEWLKLNRTGNVFTGSVSPDGTNWTVINSRSITMNSTLLVGFAVCSRNNGYLDTAVFDNVSISGLWPTLPGAPSPLIGLAGDSLALLSWPSSTNSTGYNLKRGNSSSGPFTVIATNFSGLAFSNTGLTNGALYYYVVSGTNYFGESTNSAAISVRPVSTSSPQLGAELIASQMQFNWPTSHVGWRLQTQTNSLTSGLGTNWFTVSGSSATNLILIPVDPAIDSVFYRLVYP